MKAKAWLAGALAVPFLVIWFHHVRNPPPGNPVQGPAHGGVLRIMTQAVDSLDPIHSRNYWESGIVLQLFDGLVRLDEHLAIAPAIARDWRISFDGTTYTFRLRRDVRFHNGRPVTARDFVYSLTRLVDPRWKAVDSEYYARIGGAAAFRSGRSDHVSGFRALDSHTLQITLEQPYAPFLQVLALSSASVVPREAVESRERPFDRSPVGTGAFRLMRPGSGHEIHLESHPHHFLGKPYLDELRIRTVAALTDRESFREFARGRLDLSFIPTDRIPQASARPDWEVRTFPVLRLLYLGMNVKTPRRQPTVAEKSRLSGHRPGSSLRRFERLRAHRSPDSLLAVGVAKDNSPEAEPGGSQGDSATTGAAPGTAAPAEPLDFRPAAGGPPQGGTSPGGPPLHRTEDRCPEREFHGGNSSTESTRAEPRCSCLGR